METAIVTGIVAVIQYFAARGADAILGKWVAYFTIAWQTQATDKARAEYGATIDRIKTGMAVNGQSIVDWRKDHWPQNGEKP